MKRGFLTSAAAIALVLAVPFAAHADDAPPPADTPIPPPVVMPPIPSDPYVPPPPPPVAPPYTPPPGPGTEYTPGPDFIPWTGFPSTSYGCHYADPGGPCMQVPTGQVALTDAQIRALVYAPYAMGGSIDLQYNPDGSMLARPFGSDEPWVLISGKVGLAPFPPGTIKMLQDPPILKLMDPVVIEKHLTAD